MLDMFSSHPEGSGTLPRLAYVHNIYFMWYHGENTVQCVLVIKVKKIFRILRSSFCFSSDHHTSKSKPVSNLSRRMETIRAANLMEIYLIGINSLLIIQMIGVEESSTV
jgi:hypothetical protein